MADEWFVNHSLFVVKKVLKVSIIKNRSLFVSLSVPQFYRETTLRTPRELPETATTEKVLFVKIALPQRNLCYGNMTISLPCQMPLSISFTPLCKVSLHSRISAKMSHR